MDRRPLRMTNGCPESWSGGLDTGSASVAWSGSARSNAGHVAAPSVTGLRVYRSHVPSRRPGPGGSGSRRGPRCLRRALSLPVSRSRTLGARPGVWDWARGVVRSEWDVAPRLEEPLPEVPRAALHGSRRRKAGAGRATGGRRVPRLDPTAPEGWGAGAGSRRVTRHADGRERGLR